MTGWLAGANRMSDSGGSFPNLSDAHAKMLLVESSIKPEIILERGYRTITKKSDLVRLGFAKSQQNAPALLIPIFGPNGDIVLYQSRPDAPRISAKSKKPIKYETLAGAAMRLDVHPSIRDRLTNPAIPLWITEGVKKSDALASQDLTAIALIGVWNWRGTNEHGGTTALPEWESVALNGRDVTIVFDSDVMTKSEVYKALERLSVFLSHRGSHVHYVYLPDAPDGRKIGVDDYFCLGHSLDELKSLQTDKLKAPPVSETDTPIAGNFADTGRLCWRKVTFSEGTETVTNVPLCNFTARIIEQVTIDDGAELRRHLKLSGKLDTGQTLPTVEVPASQFSSFNWLSESWGSLAIISAGQSNRDRLREAIQRFSVKDGITDTQTYAHLGWRKLENEWHYLHAAGAITAQGNTSAVLVTPGDDLAAYALPDCTDQQAAIKSSLYFLTLADEAVTLPLHLSIFRATLDRSDFSVYLSGITGAGKTTLARAMLAHFGITDEYHPPTFESTANALEGMAFVAKDTALLIDDYAPQQDRRNADAYQRTAARLLRAQGNGQGRSRMNPDGTLKPTKPPRGLLIITGEDLARGSSIRARCLIFDLKPDTLNLKNMTVYQRMDGMQAQAMTAWLQWLAPRLDEVRAALRQSRAQYREYFESSHGRTTDAAAELLFIADVLESFLAEHGVEAPELRQRAYSALLSLADAQQEHQQDQDESRRFVSYVEAALSSGRAHVTTKQGYAPQGALEYGWKQTETPHGATLQAQGPRIGWLDDDSSLLLDPTAAYAAAQKMAQDSGDLIGVTARTLWKRMNEQGFLVSNRNDSNLYKATIHGKRINVLKIPEVISCANRDFRASEDKQRQAQGKRCPEKFYWPENSRDASKAPSGTGDTGPKIIGTPEVIGTPEIPSGTEQSVTVPKVPETGTYTQAEKKERTPFETVEFF